METPDDTPADADALFDASGFFADDAEPAGGGPTTVLEDKRVRPGPWAARAALAALTAVLAGVAGFVGVHFGLAGGLPGSSGAAASEGTDPSSGPGTEEALPGQRAPAAWDVDWNATYDRPQDETSAYPVTPLASFDDGLDPKELPPLAPRPSPRFPVAYETTDAIWDAVGPGWGVAVYSARSFQGADSAGLRDLPASVYLVSPEGRHFHLWDFTEDGGTDGLALSAWIGDVDLELGWIAVRHDLATEDAEHTTFEVRDLRSGAILTSGSEGEGYYEGTDRILLGTASDGRSAWTDVVYSGGEGGGDTTVTVFAGTAAGAETTVTITPPAGAPFWGVSRLGADSDAVLFQFGSFGGDSYVVVDLATETATEVHPRLPGDTSHGCLSFTNVTPDSAIADCGYGGAAFGRYRLDLTGASDPVRLGPGEDPDNGDWSLPGWELVPTPGDVGRQGLDDVSDGARTSVILPAPHATTWWGNTPARPQEFAPNLYVFAETEQGLVLGYDRNARKVFAVCPEFWEDTQVVSALSGYALLYDTIGG